jgi:hypothetical protein
MAPQRGVSTSGQRVTWLDTDGLAADQLSDDACPQQCPLRFKGAFCVDARFVIADVTEAKSIPQELSHIIPFMPSVPILPIVQEGHQEYAMFEHWKQFTTVLSMSTYRSADELIGNLQSLVLQPITSWENGHDRSVDLARQNEALMAEIQRLRQQITGQAAGPTTPPPGAR